MANQNYIKLSTFLRLPLGFAKLGRKAKNDFLERHVWNYRIKYIPSLGQILYIVTLKDGSKVQGGGKKKGEDRIGTYLMLALNRELLSLLLPPQFVSVSVLQELDVLQEVTSIYQCKKRNVLLSVVLSALLPPAQQLKQHAVPAALDFHCFNTMSFFKHGLSQAFRL